MVHRLPGKDPLALGRSHSPVIPCLRERPRGLQYNPYVRLSWDGAVSLASHAAIGPDPPICSAMRWASVARKKTSLSFDPRSSSMSSLSRRSAAMMSALATSTTSGIAPYIHRATGQQMNARELSGETTTRT